MLSQHTYLTPIRISFVSKLVISSSSRTLASWIEVEISRPRFMLDCFVWCPAALGNLEHCNNKLKKMYFQRLRACYSFHWKFLIFSQNKFFSNQTLLELITSLCYSFLPFNVTSHSQNTVPQELTSKRHIYFTYMLDVTPDSHHIYIFLVLRCNFIVNIVILCMNMPWLYSQIYILHYFHN